jgi:hypothetical protein
MVDFSFRDHVFIVGPTRTGTTALFRALSRVPGITPTKIKELNYFFEGNSSQEYSEFLSGNTEKFSLEASPEYFVYSDSVSKKVYDFDSNSRIVVVLRDPVERLESILNHILMKRSPGKYSGLKQLLGLQIKEEPARLSERDRFALLESDYAIHMGHWIEKFESTNIMILFYEELFSPDLLDRICSFLNLSSEGVELTEENKTRIVKNIRLHKLAQKINMSMEQFLNKFPLIRRLIRSLYYSINEKPKNENNCLSVQEIKELYCYYGRNNLLLKQQLRYLNVLDERFPKWLQSDELSQRK